MATWATRGLRGSLLEDMINRTNEQYRQAGLALIQKIPTPIKPLQMGKVPGQISLAYFEQKSTVDYIGVVQGIPVCFDAKEVKGENFSLQNIHQHQYEFMNEFESQGGVSFLLTYFYKYDEIIYIRFKDIKKFIERAKVGGRKSIKYNELDLNFTLPARANYLVHYLEMLNKDIGGRNE